MQVARAKPPGHNVDDVAALTVEYFQEFMECFVSSLPIRRDAVFSFPGSAAAGVRTCVCKLCVAVRYAATDGEKPRRFLVSSELVVAKHCKCSL